LEIIAVMPRVVMTGKFKMQIRLGALELKDNGNMNTIHGERN